MSALDKNYNWNGNYKLKKELKETVFKVTNLKYPEKLYLFVQDDNTIDYAVIDEYFGMPALANTHDGEYSIEVRKNVVDILNKLEEDGYIEKIAS
jgi:hypothetical protein